MDVCVCVCVCVCVWWKQIFQSIEAGSLRTVGNRVKNTFVPGHPLGADAQAAQLCGYPETRGLLSQEEQLPGAPQNLRPLKMHLSSCFPVFGLLLHLFLTCYSENFLLVHDGRFLQGRVCPGTLAQFMYGEYFVWWSPTPDRADGALPVPVPHGSQSSISLIWSLPQPSEPDSRDFLCGPVVKNLPSKAGDAGLIPGLKLRSDMPWGN